MNEMYLCINRNARPNNNQLINYYEHVSYLPEIHTVPCRTYLQYSDVGLQESLLFALI